MYNIGAANNATTIYTNTTNVKIGKSNPLQTWIGHEGSRRLRLADFKTINT
jgi:hypothetical protein